MKNNTFISLLLCIFSISLAIAQSDLCDEHSMELQQLQGQFSRLDLDQVKLKTDSIQPILESTCLKGKMLMDIIYGRYNFKKGNFTEAHDFYDQALANANILDKRVSQKHILSLKATIFSEEQKYDLAKIFFEKALKIDCHPDSLACLKQNIRLTINAATDLSKSNEVKKSIQKFVEADSLMNLYELKDSIYRVVIFNSMANIYDEQLDDQVSSLQSYKKALQYCPNGHSVRYRLLNNLGNGYKRNNQIDSAKFYYNKTISETNLPRLLIIPFQGIGDLHLTKNEFNLAIENYTKALKNAKSSAKLGLVKSSTLLLAKANYLKGNHKKASAFFDQYDKFNSNTHFTSLEDAGTYKYQLLNRLGSTNATLHADFYSFLRKYDSIHSERRSLALNSSITRFEKRILNDSLHRAQIFQNNQELIIKNQNYKNLALLFFLVSSVLGGLLLYSKFRKTKKINEALGFKVEELESINLKLEAKANEATSIIDESKSKSIKINSFDKSYNLQLKEICHIVAEDNGSRIKTSGESIWTNEPTKALEERISNSKLLRISRSTLVNIEYIKWVNHKTLKMKDGNEFKIGRTYKSDIIEAFNRF